MINKKLDFIHAISTKNFLNINSPSKNNTHHYIQTENDNTHTFGKSSGTTGPSADEAGVFTMA